MITKVTAFKASDGTLFETSQEADKHNDGIKIRNRENQLDICFRDIYFDNKNYLIQKGWRDEDKFVESMMSLMDYCDPDFVKFDMIVKNIFLIKNAYKG